jgi:hypothetical protein
MNLRMVTLMQGKEAGADRNSKDLIIVLVRVLPNHI